MGVGEDEIRHEEANSAAEGAAASQIGPAATDTARAKEESPPDLPASQAPQCEVDDAGAKPEGVAASDRSHTAAAKAIAILAGEPVGGPSTESEPAVHPRQRSWRFAPLAATIALAAAAGSFLGALTAGGLAHYPPAPAAAAGTTAERHDGSESLKAQLAALTAFKASIDRANRSATAQLAKIGQRLDILEQAQAGPAAKLARVAEALDRLEKQRAAAADITGSIAGNPPSKTSAPSQHAGASNVTGSIAGNPASKMSAPGVSAPVLQSWIIDDVRHGRAMVESRYGDVFVVGAGSVLPGLGRVEQIERQDGRWVVVTASGLIASPR